jgi:endoglycosylceramidase
MGRVGTSTFALLATAMLAASCSSSSPGAPTAPKPFSVTRGALRDASGRTLVLRGANVAGSQKMPPHIAAFTAADYARLRDVWGFDSMRYIMTWSAIEPQKGVYDTQYLDAVATRIGWARDAGLLVVLDMHQDLYGEGFAGGDGAPSWTCDAARYSAFKPTDPWYFGSIDPNVEACADALYVPGETRDHFVEAWRRVASRLASFDNVVGFDPLNEPHWGTYSINSFEEERLAPFYVEVATAVRAEAPSWLVFAEPGASRNVGYPSHLPRLPFDGVVYAPHSYDNDAEGGAGFDPGHRAAILQKLVDYRAEADAIGAALWIGEYGGQADKPGITEYMSAQYDAAGAVGAGTTYWSFDEGDGGYSLLAADGSEKAVLADVLARPYPSRVAGDLQGYDFDAATRTATIRFAPDRAIATPTEIVVPARAYPSGVAVDCGGCDAAVLPGLVQLRTPPPGDRATVVLRPL